ncbi:MAG: hypothetical protein C0594_07870 [Marinilabiliales bacterium]|nr:MAG: hypothetical protein C0594_07870 [Marinilabiliales bacterium]
MNVKRFFYLIVVLVATTNIGNSQIAIPYYNSFDSGTDEGWSHYSIQGTDDWQHGIPSGASLNSSLSGNNVWATNLAGNFTQNSIMCLESPDFNLTDTTEFVLSFAHQYKTYSYHGGNIEYSIDSGLTWTLLNGTTDEKINWIGTSNISILEQPGWSGNYYSSGFKFSSHSLGFLSGEPAVRFRFKFGGTSNPQEGWVIDNFRIEPNGVNIVGINGITTHVSKYFETFDVTAPIYYSGLLTPTYPNQTNYYFSYDDSLDTGDSLLGYKTGNITASIAEWSTTFDMIPGLYYGDYYIFMVHDFNDSLQETNEADNNAYMILHVDSTFVPPYREDFESTDNWWNTYAKSTQYGSVLGSDYWAFGSNSLHKIFGTHSGSNAWYIEEPPVSGASQTSHFLESPYLDLSDSISHVVCFWFKFFNEYYSTYNSDIEMTKSTTYPYSSSYYNTSLPIESGRFNDWDCDCQALNSVFGYHSSKIRFRLDSYAHYTNYADYMVVDDIYIGPPLPDLSIEHNHSRTLNNIQPIDTLFYTLFNSGLNEAISSQTNFYWSTDSLLDAGDQFLGNNIEPVLSDTSFISCNFGFTLPTNVAGNYYIISKVDADSIIDEMWESNNITVFPVVLNTILQVPYENDFENQIDNWYHLSLFGSDEWSWASPSGSVITEAFSGQKAMITQPSGIAASQSLMLLYTPVFELSGLADPILEFDMFFDNYTNITYTYNQPHINMSYSVNNGKSWHVLDTTNWSFKSWYYPMEYESYGGVDNFYYAPSSSSLLFEPYEKSFIASNGYQSRDGQRIYKYVLDISHLKSYPRVQFRYNFVTPVNSLGEGALIDNFIIRDKFIDLAVDYKKSLYKSPNSDYISFFMHISNNGNYISDTATVAFYLSTDSLLNGSDLAIGSEVIPGIRPDCRYYLNSMLPCSTTISGYNYLIYQLDSDNSNTEINEANNIGSWPLSTEGIQEYPYLNEFSDTILHGWTHYVYRNSTHYKTQYRFRNITAINEPLYQSGIVSGEMFTDRINGTMNTSQVPTWYLETPNFDFSNLENIQMSFDMMCMGRSGDDGGNLEYSTNGGITWSLLTSSYGTVTNWFNSSSLSDLNNEAGWSGLNTTLDPRSIDVSFLSGQSSVVFRYKYRSNWEPYGGGTKQGMRIDNFLIEGDYIVNTDEISDQNVLIYPNPTSDVVYIDILDPNKTDYSIIVSDITGKVLLNKDNNKSKAQIYCGDLSPGLYFVELNGNVNYKMKLIVN